MATILIVDDRPTNRELLVTLLGYAGHRVLEAADGEMGLAIARAEHPDLIITDIVMPTMDGYEFARQVRADPAIRETQIIFHTSSYVVAETRRLAEACGVHTVLAKPIEPEILLETVKSTLESTQKPVIPAPASDDFHRDHMRLLTDSLAKKVEELEAEIAERGHAEERFRLVVESAPNAILAVNREGLIEMVNSQAERLFGYERSELMGLNIDTLVPEKSRSIHLNHRLSYFNELETRPMGIGRELYAVRNDGTAFPVEIGLTPITTAEGLLVIATVVDITQRKQAEENIARQNQRLRVLREIDLAILAADSTEEIVTAALAHTRELIACRRANLTLIDRTTNELVIFEVMTADETSIPKGSRLPLAQFEDILQTLSQNQPIVFSDFRALADPIAGIQRLLNEGLLSTCSLPLFSQGTLIGMFSMHSEIPGFFDEEKINLAREIANQVAIAITQRRLMEAVQESQSNQKGLLESTDDQMWSVDNDYRLITGNTKFHEYIEQILGRALPPGESLLQEAIPQELRDEWRRYFDRALSGETFMVETYSDLVSPSRYREFRFHPIFSVEGEIIGAAVSGRDTTERKRAEEQLRQSEENFSKAFSSSPTALMITRRADGKYLELNKAYTSIVGFERSELIGRLTTEFNIYVNPDQRQEIVSQLIANGSLYNYETQIQNKSGELRTVLASLEMIQFSGEDCILTTLVDITERKQAEEAHERLAAIVESSGDAIVGTTLDGMITSWNSGAEKVYGFASVEVVGLSISILIPPDLSDELPKILKQVSTGESIQRLETAQLRKDGQRIIVSLTISPVSDAEGNMLGASTIARDITARKQAEEKIAYQSHLLENVNDAIVATDAQFNLTNWNHAAAKLYGYTAEEVRGRKVQEILRSEITDEQRSSAIQSLNENGSYRMEVLQHHRDGHAFWVEGSTFAMKQSDGHIYGYISINRDITKRRQAEEAVRAKNEEIKAMSQQLWQAAKLATMGELAASIAHELNNPLATVSLRTEMLQSQFGPDDPQSKSLQIIDSEVKRMSGLVMNLLQFSRRNSSQTSTININEEVANSLELVQYHLRKNGVRTVQELSPELPFVHADRQQLRQVFLNLFTNAVDAMPLGGILTIRSWWGEKPDAGITAPLRPSANQSLGLPTPDVPQVFIDVSDTGEGIKTDNLERVWEPFYTTKPEGKGTGLGLAICRRIIQEHGGNIKVFSDGIPGKGTTIQLTLPVQKER